MLHSFQLYLMESKEAEIEALTYLLDQGLISNREWVEQSVLAGHPTRPEHWDHRYYMWIKLSVVPAASSEESLARPIEQRVNSIPSAAVVSIEAAVNEVLQQGALHAQVEEIGEV